MFAFAELYELLISSSGPFRISFDGYIDSVSAGYGSRNNCGAISYEVLNDKNQVPPAFFSLKHLKSDNLVIIEVDLASS